MRQFVFMPLVSDNASGKGITWSVNVPSAGAYSLVWRFANGTTSNRTGQLMVDGTTVIPGISMTGTGSWTTWTETKNIRLKRKYCKKHYKRIKSGNCYN